MNSKAILAIAAFAAIASTGVRAGEAGEQSATRFESSRTRADVMAEAASVATYRRIELSDAPVAAPLKSDVDSKALRAQAAQAVRLGHLASGEAGSV